MFWYDTRTPFKEILTSIICTNIVNDEIISNETMNNQIKPSSLKQKERRAEWKRCFEKVQNDPTGNHTQEELENSANHKKTLAQNKAQYERRKRKAAINSREKQRQLINGREYAKKCRARKKERETMDPYVIDNNPSVYNETLTSLSISTDRNAIDNNPPVSSISSSDDKIEGSKNVEEESERLISTDSSNLTHANVNDNKEGSNNDTTTCSRSFLQDSPTTSPRKSTQSHNREEIEEETDDTQNFTEFDYSHLNNTERTLILGLECDLFLWKVPRQSSLGTRVLNHCLEIVQPTSTFVVKEATPINLPEDIEQAFKRMLDVEINSEKVVFSKLIDQIEEMSKVEEGDKLFGQPYYSRQKERFLKDSFKKSIYTEFLNPVKRFSIVKQTKRQNLLESFADDNCLNGYVFEIVLAHHFQHKQIACISCGNKTLLWNGGSDHPWMDVVCTSCNSTYEIKSKKDFETAQKLLRDNKIEGGCFRSFFNLSGKYQNSRDTNHYLIVVGRAAMKDSHNNDSYHCYLIAPIKDVLPIVNPKTFANVQHPKLKTKIRTGSYYKSFKIVGAKFSGPTSDTTWKSVASTYLNNHPDLE